MRKQNIVQHDTTVVKLRGLPWRVTEEEIVKFFDGLELNKEKGVHIHLDRTGRASGEAFVQFESTEDCEKALKRNMEKIGHSDLHAGLQCIRSYTRRCMSMQQRTHFNKLYHGTGEVIHELCEDGPYQEDYLRHAPCMRHFKSQYELCSKRYQNTMTKISQTTPDENELRQQQQRQQYQQQYQEQYQQQQPEFNNTRNEDEGSDGIRAVCCAFKEYIACSEQTVKRTCGREAAYFTRSFLDKISNSLFKMHCENYHSEPGECGEPSASPRTIFSTLCSVYSALFVIALQRFV